MLLIDDQTPYDCKMANKWWHGSWKNCYLGLEIPSKVLEFCLPWSVGTMYSDIQVHSIFFKPGSTLCFPGAAMVIINIDKIEHIC